MSFVSDLFTNLFPTWSGRGIGARNAAATQAREAAFHSFQKLLKDGGYAEVPRTIQPPSMDIGDGPASDEPTRDTQDGPSSNPKGAEASREGPASRRAKPIRDA